MESPALDIHDEIADQHRRIALFVAEGYTTRDISTAMGIPEGTIRNLKRSPIFNRLVHECMADIIVDARIGQARLQQVSNRAIDFADDLIAKGPHDDARILKIQAETALSIMSRAGLGETVNVNSKNESRSISAILTAEEMQEIRQRKQHAYSADSSK